MMELYTLDRTFLPAKVLDEFVSAIWTERFIEAGDVTLTVEATLKNINALKPGTFLGLKGSDEVMLLETHKVDKGVLTVTGRTLEAFLENRVIQGPLVNTDPPYPAWVITAAPDRMIREVVDKSIVNRPPVPGNGYLQYCERVIARSNSIANLTVSTEDDGGELDQNTSYIRLVQETFEDGPLYPKLLSVAQQYHVGMFLKLKEANESGYKLEFSTYMGFTKSEISDGLFDLLTVQFSEDLGTLSGISEVKSIADVKNFVMGRATDENINAHPMTTQYIYDPKVFITGPFASGNEDVWGDDWVRRFAIIRPSIEEDEITKLGSKPIFFTDTTQAGDPGNAALGQLVLQEVAKLLAEKVPVHLIDGELPPSRYKFNVHYRLGDLVERQGSNGVTIGGQVTEYIRSQDASGSRSYPTLSPLPVDTSEVPPVPPDWVPPYFG